MSDSPPQAGPSRSSPQPPHLAAVKPAPAVVLAASHVVAHTHPRRFLGPVPEMFVNSNQNTERRERQHALRHRALQKLIRNDNILREADKDPDGSGSSSDDAGEMGVRERTVYKIRVRRDNVTNDIMLSSDSESSGDDDAHPQSKHKKKKRKNAKGEKKKKKKSKLGNIMSDPWFGNSFDIGCEFKITEGRTLSTTPVKAGLGSTVLDEIPGVGLDSASGRSSPPLSVHNGRHSEDDLPSKDDPPYKMEPPKEPPGRGPSDHGSGPQSTSRRKGKNVPRRDSAGAASSSVATTAASSYKTAAATPPLRRPGSSVSSAADSFQSARSEINESSEDISGLYHRHQPSPLRPQGGLHPNSEAGTSTDKLSRVVSDTSTRPLLTFPAEEGHRGAHHTRTSSDGSRSSFFRKFSFTKDKDPSSPSGAGFSKLRSAIRQSSTHDVRESGDGASVPLQQKRSKTVQFPAQLAQVMPTAGHTPTPRSGDQKPAAPEDVLARTGPEAAGTSVGATEPDMAIDTDDFRPGAYVMRDRVLVKVGRHREENLGPFDERIQRRSPCYRLEPMEEFIIGMTMTSLDFYQDWEAWKGFKRLRFSVPLNLPTTLSVFNRRDMTLAVTCPWETVIRQTMRDLHRHGRRSTSLGDRIWYGQTSDMFGVEHEGTAVFLVKFVARSRALDWHWLIYEQLDPDIPPVVDVRLPVVEETIRVPIPEDNASKKINRSAILGIVRKVMKESPTAIIILRELGEEPRMELAWKGPDGTLDWVAYATTVTGRKRDWALLASFAHASSGSQRCNLQARRACHHANRLKLQDGTRLEEPGGVEGFLVRHHDGSHQELVYVSTHDGVAYMSPAGNARPPLLPKRTGSSPADIFPTVYRAFVLAEQWRKAHFIKRCSGCLDLRDVVSVRLLNPSVAAEGEPGLPELSLSRSRAPVTPREGSPKEREIEIQLASGATIVWEAHTPVIAAEWVAHLQELIEYWSMYHRIDARERMDVIAQHGSDVAFPAEDLGIDTERALDRIWNWCVIEGCRTVTAAGRIYARLGSGGHFKLIYLVLTGGALVSFRVKNMKNLRPRKKVYPLFGAYVYSGLLAQEELPETVNEAAFNPNARIYQDGLQTTDGAEDCTFCVRITWPKRKTNPWDQRARLDNGATGTGGGGGRRRRRGAGRNTSGSGDGAEGERRSGSDGGSESESAGYARGSESDTDTAAEEDLPPIAPPKLTKRPTKLILFRARCQLERDRWIWAINAEVERQARAHRSEEEQLRNFGALPMQVTTLRHDRSYVSHRSQTSSLSWSD